MEVNEIISSGILEEYVLGLTSEADSARIHSYMQTLPLIKQEVENISKSIETYASSYSVTPPAFIKERILEAINQSTGNTSPNYNQASDKLIKSQAPVYKINSLLKFAAAACFFLLLGSIFINLSLYNKYNRSKSDIASIKQELDSQKQVAIDINSDMNVVKNKMAVPVVLNGTPHSPEALAKIFWMKNTGDVYVDASNLPSIPADKQFQLWAIVDGKPVDAGMISTDNGKVFRIQKMKSFGKAQAFAITVEKKGGSEAPTMNEMVVIAKI